MSTMHAPIPTVFKDNAATFAARDTDARADMVLDVACKEAVALIRAGKPGRAAYKIARAGLSAERLIGRAS